MPCFQEDQEHPDVLKSTIEELKIGTRYQVASVSEK